MSQPMARRPRYWCRRLAARRAGFTLLEMTAAAVISSLLAAVGLQALRATTEAMGTLYGQGILQTELTQATDAFARDAALAMRLPSSGSGYTRDPDGSDNAATLILEVPGLGVDGTPSVGFPDHIVYRFFVDPGTGSRRLQREVIPGLQTVRTAQTNVLSNQISSVKWSWNKANEDGAGSSGTGRLVAVTELKGSRLQNGRTYYLTVVARTVMRNAAP